MDKQCSGCRSVSLLASFCGAAILGGSLSSNLYVALACGGVGILIGIGATKKKGAANG